MTPNNARAELVAMVIIDLANEVLGIIRKENPTTEELRNAIRQAAYIGSRSEALEEYLGGTIAAKLFPTVPPKTE